MMHMTYQYHEYEWRRFNFDIAVSLNLWWTVVVCIFLGNMGVTRPYWPSLGVWDLRCSMDDQFGWLVILYISVCESPASGLDPGIDRLWLPGLLGLMLFHSVGPLLSSASVLFLWQQMIISLHSVFFTPCFCPTSFRTLRARLSTRAQYKRSNVLFMRSPSSDS